MSRTGLLFLGLLGVFTCSLGVTVLIPQSQLGTLSPDFKEEANVISDVYPTPVEGMLAKGKAVYISEGCQTCHTQMVRGAETADLERGWGVRRVVARDYLDEGFPVLGSLRLGPDLANRGWKEWRNEPVGDASAPNRDTVSWQLLHLYQPTLSSKDSNMPSYRHLFQMRKISGSRSSDALPVDAAEGFEVVPKPEARALVAYLNSLDRSHSLAEAVSASSKTPVKK